jgi:hypothetical protein
MGMKNCTWTMVWLVTICGMALLPSCRHIASSDADTGSDGDSDADADADADAPLRSRP